MPTLIKSFYNKIKSAGTTLIKMDMSSGFDNRTDINNLNAYKDSLYLYIGVSMIAKRCAGIVLELYKIKNKKGDVTEVFEHELLTVLNHPNTFQSRREFIELSVAYYLLSGDCFWLFDRVGSKIVSVVPLRPDNVEIILNREGTEIIAYEFRNGTIKRYLPENVLHIRNIDPTNPLRGVGVVRPATSRILTEIEATKYQANFFQNQGRPDMAVFADSDVDDEKGAHFRAVWKNTFGRGKGGQVAIFGRNVKSIQELNNTPKEMDFIETQKFLRMDILSALHIPEEMVSSDGSNRATSKEAYKLYLQEAVIPVFEAFEDAINHKLVPQIDVSVFFSHTDPTPVDRELQLKEVSTLKDKGIISQNEARAYYNYDAVEGGDTFAVAQATPPALAEKAKQFIRSRQLLAKKLTTIEKMVAIIHNNEPSRKANSIFPTKAAKDAYAKAFNSKADRKAETLKEAIDDFHAGMLKRVLDTPLSPTTFMDVIGEKSLAKATLGPVMQKLYKDGGQDALDGLARKASEHFFTNAVLLAAIDSRTEFFTNSIVDTTFEVLKSKITDGIAEGYSVEKIGRSIRDYFEDMTVKRARTIAQTETNFVLSKATNDAYSQSSIVTGKEWISVGDTNVREEHVENEAQGVIGKNESFSNGEDHPGESSVNCRCVLAPAV